MEWVIWVLLFVIAIGFQMVSVVRGSRWGMLTSSVRWLRARLAGRMLLFPAWSWLTWHWFIEPRVLASSWVDDALAVGVGVLLAFLVDYEDWFATKRVEEARSSAEE